MKNKTNLLAIALLLISTYGFSQNALDFDGVNDYVSAPNASALISGSTSFSMSFWAYPTNPSSAFPNFDGYAGFRNGTNADFYVLQLGSNQLEARFRNSSGTNYDIVATGFTLNTWNHIAMTYSGTQIKLYINGNLVGTQAATGSISNSSVPFDMGYLYFSIANSFYFNGKLDHVALWSTALTAAQVTALNASTCNYDITDPTLLLSYEFNQGVSGGANSSITSLIASKGNINGAITNLALSGTSSNFVAGVPGADVNTTYDTACVSYQYKGATLTATGIYSDTFTNAMGCDSIIQLDLLIPVIDTTVTVISNNTLRAFEAFVGYQWIDCGTNTPVAGATSRSFTPTTSGNYAVIITKNGCSATSGCRTMTVSTSGITENELESTQVFPNPFTDIITISFPELVKNGSVQITNVAGQLIRSEQLTNQNELRINLENVTPGVYLIQINSLENRATFKVVKE